MKMCAILWHILFFLLRFTTESNSQPGFCRDKPVVKFCTDYGLTNLTDINIDTVSVPRYEENFCECAILPFVSGIIFTFSYYNKEVPRNMVFKIDSALLSSKEATTVRITDRAKLSLLTTKNYTSEGTCLIVSTGIVL
ncbi:uncharacterized protein LOC123544293 [Mercenaria mercenaria]|uniref:uncharacterized protein LOC123544293 n=1 Tax=Mercenaria mercenaria TaxID=6596 RepID=UPI00234E5CF7|nr:uncharacterized protein LOC123544293 [Mercenaria mercenaria]